jgi:hypothetical protein
MAENGKPEEIDLNALRLLLADLATGHVRHEHMMQQHAEEMVRMRREDEDVRRRHDTEIAEIRAVLRDHAEIMARVDERLDRMSRHLEAHSDIIDSLICGKPDRKKRG